MLSTKHGCFNILGIQFDVKKITVNSHYQPCFCVFDILMYNDKILTNVPLNERLTYLDNLFDDVNGVIIKSKRLLTTLKYKLIKYSFYLQKLTYLTFIGMMFLIH